MNKSHFESYPVLDTGDSAEKVPHKYSLLIARNVNIHTQYILNDAIKV